MDPRKELIFNTLCKISPIGIEVVDFTSKKLISASKWMSEHMGYSPEEFDVASINLFEKIIHPDDRKTQLDAYEALIANPQTIYKEFTTRVRRKDGEYIYASIRLTVLEVDSNNQPTTLLSTAMDVTEIVKLKEQLSHELNKLEVISYKNSHQLRGPVATILGLIQLIDYTGLNGTHSEEIIVCLKETVIKLDTVIHEINNHIEHR